MANAEGADAEGAALQYSEDSLLGGRVRLRQPAAGYRVAIDPVLLAAAVPAREGERALDVGAGTGAAALCLCVRVAGVHVTGLERDPALARLAAENVALNGLGAGLEILAGDLLRAPAALVPASFDHVLANPPHLRPEAVRAPGDAARAAAHVEGEAGLDAWLRFLLAMARPGATVTLVHRPERLGEILAGLGAGAGAIVVFPLWPGAAKAAKRVIVQARVGRAAPLRLAPGLVLHAAAGAYTPEAEAVLRDGAALTL